MYFDVEDFLSSPDAPVHQLPGQMAEIMTRHGLPGSFHIMGEKVRFMERHQQRRVIDAIRDHHDVSLHYDRGSIHPTTAEECSHLDWFQGVDRVIFREQPGFQTLERVFGRCSSLAQHGATFSTQAIYAAGKLGKPYFFSPYHGPFELPGRNVVWYCNNLLIGGGEGGNFDRIYRDDEAFEAKLEAQNDYLRSRIGKADLTPLFGCHPLITIMQEFPCAINFEYGARPPREQWQAPTMVPGISIEQVLANFERRIESLATLDGIEWTTTGEIAELYRQHPVRVSDEAVLAGAEAVIENRGPTFTELLSAGELLCLLARRYLAPADSYEVPQVMGPVVAAPNVVRELSGNIDLRGACLELIEQVWNGSYLPEALSDDHGNLCPEALLVILACEATGTALDTIDSPRLTVEAIPGVSVAAAKVAKTKDWHIHERGFDQEATSRTFTRQGWTLKPAFRANEYAEGVEIGPHLNPSLPFAMGG